MTATYALDRGISLERTFNAPPDVVFDCWTRPELLGWFFNPGYEPEQPPLVDLRVGGQWRQQMIESPERKYYTGGVYREIQPARRLSFYWGAVGGWPALDPASPEANPLVTFRLAPLGRRTFMDFRVHFPDQYLEQTVEWWMGTGMETGWHVTVDRLSRQLAPVA